MAYRGERLSAALINRMAAAAMGSGQLRVQAAGGRASGGPLGSSVADPDLAVLSDNVILCQAQETMAVFTVVEVEDTVNDLGIDYTVKAQLIFREGTSRIGILLAPCLPGEVVPVQIAGVQLVKYSWDDPDDLEVGDRLLGLKHKPYPVRCHGGPLLVKAIAVHDVAWTDYNYALVHITRNRLGSVYIRDCYEPPREHGPCDVLIVGIGFAVTNPQVGVVVIT